MSQRRRVPEMSAEASICILGRTRRQLTSAVCPLGRAFLLSIFRLQTRIEPDFSPQNKESELALKSIQ